MLQSTKKRVGVLRGGPGEEYKTSINSGATVLANIPDEFHGVDIFVDREGNWHRHGKVEEPHKAFQMLDVVINLIHGEYGEGGKLAHILETHRIPFTGSARLASAVSFNKGLAKLIAKKNGIQTPRYRVIARPLYSELSLIATELFRTFSQPSIIKPLAGGSSVAVSLAGTVEEIRYALELVFHYFEHAIIEEYISGKEVVCGIIDNFRGEGLYSLFPIEISLAPGARFFDKSARESDETTLSFNTKMDKNIKAELISKALFMHSILGMRHYSSSDFILHPSRGIFFLETDAVPALAENTPFLAGLRAVGASTEEFVRHIVSLATSKI